MKKISLILLMLFAGSLIGACSDAGVDEMIDNYNKKFTGESEKKSEEESKKDDKSDKNKKQSSAVEQVLYICE